MYKHIFYILIFLFASQSIFAQTTDSISKKKLEVNKISTAKAVVAASDTTATIDMYKIITIHNDTTYVDTSLTIKNEYKVNYLRKDNFGLLPLHNEGQAYNTLDFGLIKHNAFPEFGFKAKHFAYMEVTDIKYYNVATPFTDLFYRSVLQQGQMLDAFITVNTSEILNLSIGYKGLRSLGRYINALSSNGNFRFGTSYNTTDKRYYLKLHITAQDFSNQENGGIIDNDEFESGVEPFTQRERINVFFRDATSLMRGNRYFFDHSFKLSKSNPNSIVFHHQFNYENKFFEYTQSAPSNRFGDAYTSSIRNKTRHNKMYNLIGAGYSTEKFGSIEAFIEDYNYNYYYKTIILDADASIRVPNSINDRINTFGAKYNYQKNNWTGNISISNSISNQPMSDINLNIRYVVNDTTSFAAGFNKISKVPDNNYTLYQSDYIDYNWYNNFKNEKINRLFAVATTKWINADINYTILNDHLYFSNDYNEIITLENPGVLLVTPKQYNNTISYFSIKLNKEFRYRKLGLDNTFLYQKVTQNDNILNVPELVARNTLYFSDVYFKKAMYLQTGFTFQYFTSYYGNDYNPLIGEFYVQDKTKFGNFPLIDFFVNAKIKQFRLFIKAEHFNSGFTGYNYYSAPNYPYRDFTFRFGLIWDFFS